MTNNKTLYTIVIVLAVIIVVGGIFLFSGNRGGQKEAEQATAVPPTSTTAAETPAAGTGASVADKEMIDCSEATDPGCFLARMNECLPVTAKGMGSDGKTSFEVTILGIENEKCHFQRKINDVLNLNCYFPKGTLNMDTFDQTFGNDKGAEAKKIVDDACQPVGW
ncbi:MAG: hypothetical protein M1127_01120 [Patescibacteria group bacterium]|nr:hypothetical protein [Patescibacteria group bacterium]